MQHSHVPPAGFTQFFPSLSLIPTQGATCSKLRKKNMMTIFTLLLLLYNIINTITITIYATTTSIFATIMTINIT